MAHRNFFHYADLLRRLKLGTLLRRLHADRPLYCESPSPDLFSLPLVQFGILPLLPQSCRNLGKRLFGRTTIPDWISPELWRRMHMQERIRQTAFSTPFSTHAQQDIFQSTVHGLGIHGTELDERASSSFGLEKRHPFYDRRIIEFALALPEEQRWGDKPKFILRKAMGELLPTSVRERILKADFSCIFAHALLTESTAAIFQSLSIASVGWVDAGQIRTAYHTMARAYSRGDETYRFHIAQLWMIFGVELWFRTLFQGQSLHRDLPTRQEVVPSYSS